MKTFSVRGLCLSAALLTLTLVGQAQGQDANSLKLATSQPSFQIPSEIQINASQTSDHHLLQRQHLRRQC